MVAVAQEAGCFLGRPDPTLGRRRAGQDGGACGVVSEAVLADGGAQGAGERGQAPVDGHLAAACGQLGVNESGDVAVAEIVQLEGAQGGDQVAGDVVAIPGESGRLEYVRLRLQPSREVVGDGLVRVAVEPAGLALKDPLQRGLGGVLGGEAAAADGGTAVVGGGEVDGEGPASVVTIGCQSWAAGSDLVAVCVAASTAPVDSATVGDGAHGDRLLGWCDVPTIPVSVDGHTTRSPSGYIGL